MDSYKRIIAFAILAVMTQLIFAIVFGFYSLSVKKLEMNSMLLAVSELVTEDGYIDTNKLDIYEENVLEKRKFDFAKGERERSPDKLSIFISDPDLIDGSSLTPNEFPQQGHIVELTVHLETEILSQVIPEPISRLYTSRFSIPNRIIVRKWNKNRPVLLDYSQGGYLDSVDSIELTRFIDNRYNSDNPMNVFKVEEWGEGWEE